MTSPREPLQCQNSLGSFASRATRTDGGSTRRGWASGCSRLGASSGRHGECVVPTLPAATYENTMLFVVSMFQQARPRVLVLPQQTGPRRQTYAIHTLVILLRYLWGHHVYLHQLGSHPKCNWSRRIFHTTDTRSDERTSVAACVSSAYVVSPDERIRMLRELSPDSRIQAANCY